MTELLAALDDWIAEVRTEIAESKATVRGYRHANGLRDQLQRLVNYRAALRARAHEGRG